MLHFNFDLVDSCSPQLFTLISIYMNDAIHKPNRLPIAQFQIFNNSLSKLNIEDLFLNRTLLEQAQFIDYGGFNSICKDSWYVHWLRLVSIGAIFYLSKISRVGTPRQKVILV